MKLPFVGSDLDGTIVKNQDFEILQDTVNDILEYQNKSNNKFFIVTGRAWQTMKYYVNQLNVSLPVISSNGGAITDPKTNEVLFEHPIDNNIVIEILEYADKNDLDVSVYTALDLISLTTAERSNAYKRIYGHYPKELQPTLTLYNNYTDLIKDIKNDKYKVVKLMFSLDAQKEEQKAKELDKFLTEKDLYHPHTYIQSRLLFDAQPNGVNKAYGLRQWAKIVGVEPKDIIVIGDNNNDIEMVEQAKIGVSVKNGVKNLQDIANKIIDSVNNNGVGKYLAGLIKENQ